MWFLDNITTERLGAHTHNITLNREVILQHNILWVDVNEAEREVGNIMKGGEGLIRG